MVPPGAAEALPVTVQGVENSKEKTWPGFSCSTLTLTQHVVQAEQCVEAKTGGGGGGGGAGRGHLLLGEGEWVVEFDVITV